MHQSLGQPSAAQIDGLGAATCCCAGGQLGCGYALGQQPQYFIPQNSGTAANGKPAFNWDEAAQQLTRASNGWSGALGQATSVTYGFRSTAPTTMPDSTTGFSRFSSAQIQAAETALANWADVANISFSRVGSGASGEGAYTNSATILFSNYSSGVEGASAFAFFPGSRGAGSLAGDVWVNNSLAANNDLSTGDFGLHILVHEIGHAIGLSHPGDYDAGGGASPTYTADAEYWQDARMFTVMSYFGSSNTGGSLNLFSSAPQFHDIAAAQRLYGPNMSTRTGDTVYGFNSNTGLERYSLSGASPSAVFAIWDAGGVDTLDFSGYATASEIDLREEGFSSAGPGNGGVGVAVGNISIARGVVIENAIGGQGADIIIGNDTANRLEGRLGDDRIDGGAGFDTAVYSRASGGVWVSLATGNSLGAEGADTLTGIEALVGSAFSDLLFGDNGINFFDGGLDDDRIDGAGGFDTVSYVSASAGVWVNLTVAGTLGAAGRDFLISVEGVIGSRFSDLLFGDANYNQFEGGLQDDLIDGGDGIDVAIYAGATGGVWVNLAVNGTLGAEGADRLLNVENIVGSAYSDILLGDAGANELGGGGADDLINGAGGNDLLIGGAGNDLFVLAAGTGRDTVADFVRGADLLDIRGHGLTTFGALSGRISQSGADTIIDLGNGDVLVLSGIVSTSLAAGDFIFG